MSTNNPHIQQLVISDDERQASKPRFVVPIAGLIACIAAGAFYFNFAGSSIAKPSQGHSVVAKQADKQVSSEIVAVNVQQQVKSAKLPSAPINNKQSQKNQQGTSVLDASGHIVARRIATVSSRVTGKLEALLIEEGQHVKQSQLMAQLDDQQATIALELAQAEVNAMHASISELTIAQKYAEQRLARQTELAKQDMLSQQHLDDVQQSIEKLAAQYLHKQAKLVLAQKRVEQAQYQLNQHQIKAPFDGVVIRKNAQVGELISAGNSGGSIRTGVGTIVDMQSLEIEVEVGESYINRVYAGQKTTAILDAYPKWKINSEVITIIPTADRQKASIKVRIKLLERDIRVLPDMGVKVSFLS